MHVLNLLFYDANGRCKSPVLYQWEIGELNLMGLEMGITTEALQGAIFKSFLLQSVD